MNYKTYRDLAEDYLEANEAILSGIGEETDELIMMDSASRIADEFASRPMRQGQKLGDPESCSSSFVLLSLTPNTREDGDWNSDGAYLSVEVTAQKANDRKPLTPEFLKYPVDQTLPNPLVLVRPGETIATEEGATFAKAAAATVTAAAALYLF